MSGAEDISTPSVIAVDGTMISPDEENSQQWYDSAAASAIPAAPALVNEEESGDFRRPEPAPYVAYAVAAHAVHDDRHLGAAGRTPTTYQQQSFYAPTMPISRAERAQYNGYAEEEKEEIANLAGLQTGRVATFPAEMATVMGNNDIDDDAELAMMKRQAAFGGVTDFVLLDREPQPEPLQGEDFSAFYSRTIDHWNVLAAERLTGSGIDLNLDTLEDESTRMASQRWQEMQPEMNAEATIVAISESDVHPSDLGAIQAEFVGSSYATQRDVSVGSASHVSGGENVGSSPVATALADGDETTTEATVIDTAPLAKEESQEAWQTAAEAQVLENISPISAEDRKPPASENGSSVQREEYSTGNESQQEEYVVADQGSQRDEYAVADQEGMVLAIEDNVHPSEFQTGDAAAQVVGADFGFAVEQNTHQNSMAPVDAIPAMAHSEENLVAGHAEVCAVIVEENRAVSITEGEPATVSVLPSESTTTEADDIQDPPTKEVWSGPPRSNTSANGETSGASEDTGAPDDFTDDIATHSPPPPPPSRQNFGNTGREQSAASGTSEQSSSSQRSQLQNLSNNIARSTGNVMDALFGDTKGPFLGRKSRASESDITDSISPRTLLPWSVIFSPANKMWVATLQTSQKALDGNDITEASKALRAFSLPTEKQAISLARAWTPPRMMSFAENPLCHVCQSRFAVFRRACHCRNCGVCVCKDCTVQWPSNMVPDTYNTKDESYINACSSCDWLSNAFRLALLNGNMDEAVAIHATGNINLTCAFSNVKGELFYPVHCAVMGGNIHLLKWLVDQQCCPIKSVRVSGKSRDAAGRYTPIVTSKGRSLLGIAMENCYTQIVRYLVVEKGIVIAGERDITHEMLTRNMTRLLHALPDAAEDIATRESSTAELAAVAPDDTPPVPDPDGNSRSLSDGARDFGAIYQHRDVQASSNGDDECILCFDAKIDCVATPCGHQICCLGCSKNVSRCPVCAQDCSFLRVFKP